MILPPSVLARRALKARLSTLTLTGGGAFDTVFRPTIGDEYAPQRPVEVALSTDGLTPLDDNVTASTDDYLVLGVGVLCSTLLVNDDVEIEDVVLMVLADVKDFLLADVRLGLPGVVINTLIGDAEIHNSLYAGYYGGTIMVRLQIRTPRSDGF